MYNLRKQVVLALPQNPKYRSLSHHELVNMSKKISNDFFKRIPKIRALVETDVLSLIHILNTTNSHTVFSVDNRKCDKTEALIYLSLIHI